MTIQQDVYESTTSFTGLAERIHAAERIVVTTHRKPDGDAIGSVIGLCRGLRSIGKDTTLGAFIACGWSKGRTQLWVLCAQYLWWGDLSGALTIRFEFGS